MTSLARAATQVPKKDACFFPSFFLSFLFSCELSVRVMLRLTRSLSRRVFILVGAAPLPSSAHLWLPRDRLATLSERRWTSEIPSRDAGSDPHVVLLPEMNQGWIGLGFDLNFLLLDLIHVKALDSLASALSLFSRAEFTGSRKKQERCSGPCFTREATRVNPAHFPD